MVVIFFNFIVYPLVNVSEPYRPNIYPGIRHLSKYFPHVFTFLALLMVVDFQWQVWNWNYFLPIFTLFRIYHNTRLLYLKYFKSEAATSTVEPIAVNNNSADEEHKNEENSKNGTQQKDYVFSDHADLEVFSVIIGILLIVILVLSHS